MQRLTPVVCASLLAAFTLSGCETPGQTALAGAATGAAIGGLIHGRGRDALTGAAIGAGAGYVVGKIAQQRRGQRYYEDEYEQRPYYRERRYRDGRYPVGEPTERRGFVVSPYPPHNLIDVRGIPSGAKVMDPSVNRVFIAP
ncbi:MAG: glycine zipper 2TM domain-containing protein [Verrucomicrobiaceae bacterium]|nr:MAG: glycine zipper 2TM domain-containing protein [Verrucomicrobiaceae bacterium]